MTAGCLRVRDFKLELARIVMTRRVVIFKNCERWNAIELHSYDNGRGCGQFVLEGNGAISSAGSWVSTCNGAFLKIETDTPPPLSLFCHSLQLRCSTKPWW